MRECFCCGNGGGGGAGLQPEIQRAIFGVRLKDALQCYETGKRQRNPQDAGTNRAQGIRVRSDAEWHENSGACEEAHRQQRACAARPGFAQRLPERRKDGGGAQMSTCISISNSASP